MCTSLTAADYLEFKRGIAEFNRGEFFDCHETLEAVWKRQAGEERELTQAIIQVSVAYYHLFRGSYLGSRKLFERAKPRLEKFLPSALSVDVQALYELVLSMLDKLRLDELRLDKLPLDKLPNQAISEPEYARPAIRLIEPLTSC